jgi:exodeoxyribonuclease VII large subunit
MAIKPITVSQLNGYIKRILQSDPLLGNVSVIGEISNLKHHGSGHVYFTLKDETSKINCFLPSDQLKSLRYELAEGLEITAVGFLYIYERGGSYSLNIKDIVVEGKGNLSIAFDQLKDKLQQEGLFDGKYKKPIPSYPKTVAIITSETGAAVRDIIQIIRQRNDIISIIVYPCLVQGPDAARDIALAIDDVNRLFPEVDVIIAGRGGGSMEELWAFNEEIVARSIFLSTIPVISAVGHETDFTIADFVSDRRAATPTEGAQLVSPEKRVLLETINWKRQDLKRSLLHAVQYSELQMERHNVELTHRMHDRIQILHRKLDQFHNLLKSQSPYEIMGMGYGAILTSEGKLAKGVECFERGDSLTVIFKDGKINCIVEQIRRSDDESQGSN